jgi:hypothetical protein
LTTWPLGYQMIMFPDRPEFEPIVRSGPRLVEVHLTAGGDVLCGAVLDSTLGWRHWGLRYTLDELPFGSHGDLCEQCTVLASSLARDSSVS